MDIPDRTYTLVRCHQVVDYRGVRERVNVTIEDGTITRVGGEVEGDEVDCSDLVVMPGLVNSHTHASMLALRGYFDDGELEDWLKRMWEAEDKFTDELMYVSAELAVIEMLSSGTTAFVDMYFNPNQIKDLSEKYGIRASAGYTVLRGLDPEEAVKKTRSLGKSDLFTPVVNVHSIYAVGLDALTRVRDLLTGGERIHIHVSETRAEIFSVKKRYGLFPVELLWREGLIPHIQAVHLGWVTSWEIELLKSSPGVTHCPTSNMKLATGGSFPFKEMWEAGVNITLGTDGPASNNSLDMFREMRTAVLLQRHSYWNTWVKAQHVLRASTMNGYRLFKVNGGLIEPGHVADLVLLNRYDLVPALDNRTISHLVYHLTGNSVEKVIVRGRMVYRRGMFEERKRKLVEKLEEILAGLREV